MMADSDVVSGRGPPELARPTGVSGDALQTGAITHIRHHTQHVRNVHAHATIVWNHLSMNHVHEPARILPATGLVLQPHYTVDRTLGMRANTRCTNALPLPVPVSYTHLTLPTKRIV